MYDEKDIVPGLIETLKKDFELKLNSDVEVQQLLDVINSEKATYHGAQQYAMKVGRLMADTLQANVTAEILPDGKMYYNIAKRILDDQLKSNHDLVSQACLAVQTTLNKKAGIGLAAIKPEVNQNRIDMLVERLTMGDDFSKNTWLLGEPVVNHSQSVVDESVRVNAEFHHEAGLSPKIVRTTNGKCCSWCSKLAGTYDYGKVKDTGNNIFRRHQRCDCTVEYDSGNGKVRNVHTKREYRVVELSEEQKRQEKIEDLRKLNHVNDLVEFKKIQEILGYENAPESLPLLQNMKYNKPKEYEKLMDMIYVKEKLQSGEWGSIINLEKQSPHNELTKTESKSYLYKYIDAQELFNKYAGTGEIEKNRFGRTHLEICSANIDIGVDVTSGKITNMFKIHHSKNRTHIVPHSKKG